MNIRLLFPLFQNLIIYSNLHSTHYYFMKTSRSNGTDYVIGSFWFPDQSQSSLRIYLNNFSVAEIQKSIERDTQCKSVRALELTINKMRLSQEDLDLNRQYLKLPIKLVNLQFLRIIYLEDKRNYSRQMAVQLIAGLYCLKQYKLEIYCKSKTLVEEILRTRVNNNLTCFPIKKVQTSFTLKSGQKIDQQVSKHLLDVCDTSISSSLNALQENDSMKMEILHKVKEWFCVSLAMYSQETLFPFIQEIRFKSLRKVKFSFFDSSFESLSLLKAPLLQQIDSGCCSAASLKPLIKILSSRVYKISIRPMKNGCLAEAISLYQKDWLRLETFTVRNQTSYLLDGTQQTSQQDSKRNKLQSISFIAKMNITPAKTQFKFSSYKIKENALTEKFKQRMIKQI